MPMVTRLLAMLARRLEKGTRTRWIVLAIGAVLALPYLIWVQPHMTGTNVVQSVSTSVLAAEPRSGRGAGGAGTAATNPMRPEEPHLCNPFDPNCFAEGIAAFLADKLQQAFKPITDAITGSAANIITQTPEQASYGNETIKAFNQTFVTAYDGALTALLAIGAVNIMIGHHWRTLRTSWGELIPRAVLVTAAVHFNLLFLGLFLQFENALTQTVLDIAGKGILTNVIVTILTKIGLTNLLLWILLIVLVVMTVFLLFQMVGRIALVGIGLATAPLGLGCFLLPQTVRWGRLWLTTFTTAVIVQFLQVLALGIGGVFLTSIVPNLTDPVQALTVLFLTIGTLGLVLKIPGMLQNWALHPAMGGSGRDYGQGEGMSGEAFGGGGGGWGDMSTGMGESGVVEGTIVTEESGSLLLLF
jgi:hypothetical protein